MLVFVILLQLYTWLIAHSVTGTLVTIVVVAFLLRGARRMFQDHAENQLDAAKRSNKAMEPTPPDGIVSLFAVQPLPCRQPRSRRRDSSWSR